MTRFLVALATAAVTSWHGAAGATVDRLHTQAGDCNSKRTGHCHYTDRSPNCENGAMLVADVTCMTIGNECTSTADCGRNTTAWTTTSTGIGSATSGPGCKAVRMRTVVPIKSDDAAMPTASNSSVSSHGNHVGSSAVGTPLTPAPKWLLAWAQEDGVVKTDLGASKVNEEGQNCGEDNAIRYEIKNKPYAWYHRITGATDFEYCKTRKRPAIPNYKMSDRNSVRSH